MGGKAMTYSLFWIRSQWAGDILPGTMSSKGTSKGITPLEQFRLASKLCVKLDLSLKNALEIRPGRYLTAESNGFPAMVPWEWLVCPLHFHQLVQRCFQVLCRMVLKSLSLWGAETMRAVAQSPLVKSFLLRRQRLFWKASQRKSAFRETRPSIIPLTT